MYFSVFSIFFSREVILFSMLSSIIQIGRNAYKNVVYNGNMTIREDLDYAIHSEDSELDKSWTARNVLRICDLGYRYLIENKIELLDFYMNDESVPPTLREITKGYIDKVNTRKRSLKLIKDARACAVAYFIEIDCDPKLAKKDEDEIGNRSIAFLESLLKKYSR